MLFQRGVLEPHGRFERVFEGEHDAALVHPHRRLRADVAGDGGGLFGGGVSCLTEQFFPILRS